MPPKFKRHLDSSDYSGAHQSERAGLLDEQSDDEGDFFLRGPNAKPGRLKPGNEKIDRLQGQVDEVVDVMQQNIGKVLDRGEKLDDLHEKSEDLSSNATLFRARSKNLRQTMWWKNCKMKIVLAIVIIAILLIIIIPIIIKYKK